MLRTRHQHHHDLVQLLGKQLLVSETELLPHNFVELDWLAALKVESTCWLNSSEGGSKPLQFPKSSKK